MRLYDLTEQYLMLQDMLEDPDTDEQTVLDTMEAISGEIEEKANNYASIVYALLGDAAEIKKEEERLENRRRILEKRAQWLKDILKSSLEAVGMRKVKTPLFTISIQKNGGKQPLVITDILSDIPDEFLLPQPPVPDKEKIRELLAEKEVSWAHLEERGESLRIR